MTFRIFFPIPASFPQMTGTWRATCSLKIQNAELGCQKNKQKHFNNSNALIFHFYIQKQLFLISSITSLKTVMVISEALESESMIVDLDL